MKVEGTRSTKIREKDEFGDYKDRRPKKKEIEGKSPKKGNGCLYLYRG